MRTKKVNVFQYLKKETKAQRKLRECEREKNKFKRLYGEEFIEHYKIVNRLKIETYRTAYFADCVDFLHLALSQMKSISGISTKEIEEKLQEYIKFREYSSRVFMERAQGLNKIELLVDGKNKVVYLEI